MSAVMRYARPLLVSLFVAAAAPAFAQGAVSAL
jgi:hypothetical protein